MGPRNAYKDMLDNVVSPITCVSMNHQNQLEQMANEAMFATDHYGDKEDQGGGIPEDDCGGVGLIRLGDLTVRRACHPRLRCRLTANTGDRRLHHPQFHASPPKSSSAGST
jgi:hypothetical protein